VYDFAPFFLQKFERSHMSLNRQDIEKIAQLARLALDESEIPTYVENLSRIMALVGELERCDTRHVEPMAHPLPGQRQRLRADTITSSDQHDRYQRNAPQVEAGLYLVPRVIE
jgi:aspartyl-tRNA(Asn)/glutamyl-tRNA(Gln) amidotransferase subunit C